MGEFGGRSRTPKGDIEALTVELNRKEWHKRATESLEDGCHARELWPLLSEEERALARSQSGFPLGALPSVVRPTSRLTQINSQPLRVSLFRRLRFPLPFYVARLPAWCSFDPRDHHWLGLCALCWGFLGRALSRHMQPECAEGRLGKPLEAQKTGDPAPSETVDDLTELRLQGDDLTKERDSLNKRVVFQEFVPTS